MEQNTSPPPEITLLSVRQVAEALGVSRRTVWRLASVGDIPQPIRLGVQIIRWRHGDIEACLAQKGGA